MRALVVLNDAPTNPNAAELKAAAAVMAEFPELELARAVLYHRIAYSRALAEGRGVLDYLPADDKAVDEINQLYAEIYGHG